MRLLKLDSRGALSLTKDFLDKIPPYAILSHTWGADDEEVTFNDLENGLSKSKAGHTKIQFCGEQARKDKIEHFWVDTCCINKANHAELSEAITSMFRWYRNAAKCYVYLSDVSAHNRDHNRHTQRTWESAFRISRWFTRGWTLQELLAPALVEFFSQEGNLLGNKKTLEGLLHEITNIPITALHGAPLSGFPVNERLGWAAKRDTKRKEDKAYCLLGIFDIFLPLMYGEEDNAFSRLIEEINKRSGDQLFL
jgi:Heterokaryon incompatibility protein (HET)